MSKSKLAAGFLFFCFYACAQILPSASKPSQAPSKDPLDRDTPQSSVEAFLEAAQAKNYGRAWRYMDLRNLPEGQRVSDGAELARQLQSVLNRDAQFDVANLSRRPEGDLSDNLPPNRDNVASFNVRGKTLNLDLERITLHSGIAVWVFSADSVARIPEIAQELDGSPIERDLPLFLVNIRFIETPLWRWISLALLALALAALSRMLSRVALWLTKEGVKRLSPRSDLYRLGPFVGPVRLLLSVSLFRAGMVWIQPSALLRLYLGRILAFLFFGGLFWLCAVITDAIVRHLRMRMEARHRAFSSSVLPLAGRIVKIILLVFIIAAVLAAWGYNTTTLLAGLGIGGVAIALASQKTIENLFGSVSVISDRPVSVGEFCKFGSSMGTVEDIGLRSTRIRTIDRTLVTVPNGSFSAMTIENFDRKDKNLFHVRLNLKRDTTPDQMRGVLQAITEIIKDQPKVEAGAVPVRFVGIGSYSLDIEIFVYVLTLDYDEYLRLQQNLLLWFMDAIHAAGAALALPTQAFTNYAVPAPMANGSRDPHAMAKGQS